MRNKTIRYVLILIGVIMTMTIDAAAQQLGLQSSSPWPVVSIKRSVRGNVDFTLTNNGQIAQDTSNLRRGFVYPRGSEFSYLFRGGLWFGTVRKHDSRTLVFYTDNISTGWSNATPGDIDTTHAASSSVYSSATYDRQGFPIIDGPKWPLWFPTTSDSVNLMNSGIYVTDLSARNSDSYKGGAAFATVRVAEEMVARFNDMTLNNYEDGSQIATLNGYPIGLQVQQTVYELAGAPLDGAVIIRYDIVNASSDTLTGCTIGQVSDPDLGYGGNDHMTFYTADPSMRMASIWTDSDHGDTNYGKLLTVLLEAPVKDSEGYVDNSKRDLYHVGGRIGGLWRWVGNDAPKTIRDMYSAMTMFDHSVDVDNGPADQRMVMSSETFSMKPGDTAHFAIGYLAVGPEYGKTISVGPGLLQNSAQKNYSIEYPVHELANLYYYGTDYIASQVEAPGEDGAADAPSALIVLPNPAGDHASLQFSLPTTEEVTLRLVDGLGRTVGTDHLGMLAAGLHRQPLDVAGLRPGKYLVSMETPSARRVAPLTVLR